MEKNQHSLKADSPDDTDTSGLLEQTRRVMSDNWNSLGYTSPNPKRYEWQWLWDSCFHAIIWAELGEADRGLVELTTLLNTIEPSGFIPHMNYVADPSVAKELWGRSGTSSITQPPMFGHAIADLIRRGVDVPEELIDKAARGLRFFLKFRIHNPSGLITLCHPWESGADDNPRWDDYYSVPQGHPKWQDEKISFLDTINRDSNGTPIFNPAFFAASPGFTALVAFNIFELAASTGAIYYSEANELVEAIENSWNFDQNTWIDVGDAEKLCRGAPVLDALLCILADRNLERLDSVKIDIFDERKFGGQYGPAGVSKQYRTYDGDGYWRGAAWPQVSYLFTVAFKRLQLMDEAKTISNQLQRGAITSKFAEHWNPDSGKGGGASPQSWTGLAVVAN